MLTIERNLISWFAPSPPSGVWRQADGADILASVFLLTRLPNPKISGDMGFRYRYSRGAAKELHFTSLHPLQWQTKHLSPESGASYGGIGFDDYAG